MTTRLKTLIRITGATRIEVSKLLPARWLKLGTSNNIKIPLIIRDIIAKVVDSARNCKIRLSLPEPTTFLNPTSLDLLDDLAVARLI